MKKLPWTDFTQKMNASLCRRKNKNCLFLIAKVIDESNVAIYFCLIFSKCHQTKWDMIQNWKKRSSDHLNVAPEWS